MKKIFNTLIHNDPKLKKILIYDPQCIFLKKQQNINKQHYFNLCREIIGQQLSVKAAKSIWDKFTKDIKSNRALINKIKKIKIEEHKEYGLSKNKLNYLKELTLNVEKKKIQFQNLSSMSDEDIIQALTKIKGIGRWTAEMFLLFSLKRLNIFSVKDLGLRKGVMALYNLKNMDEEKILKISEKWKPYKSIVSWYLWRAIDKKLI